MDNLRKSKAVYNARCRDLMKIKEATQRVVAEAAIAGDGTLAVRVEKRRKMEEDAVAKVDFTFFLAS